MSKAADLFAKAMEAHNQGRADAALRLARKLAADHPGFGGGHYLLGLLALERGQYQPACHHLDRAQRLDPEQAAPRLRLADALMGLGRANEAIPQYVAILTHHPDHAEAHARLGTLYLNAGDNQRAADHCALALAINPGWPSVLNNLGLALGRLGRLEDAAQRHEEAVAAEPHMAGFRVNLAMALKAKGDLGVAREQAAQAVADAPELMEGWLAAGLIAKDAGAVADAALAFARAADLDPELASARFCLAEALRGLGQNAEAAEQYRACLALDPDDEHGAALGLALTGAEAAPERAPSAYVRQLFDDAAQDFDRALVDGLDYRAPQLLGLALADALGERRDLDVADLGCGTGLAGPVLRPWARRLDGIDLSPAMLELAAKRGLYDSLTEGDILAFAQDGRSYDLVVAADVLVYLGDLAAVMRAVAAGLTPRGLFAFTVERADPSIEWRLGEKSRYAHGEPYIRRSAEAVGLRVRACDPASTRSEAGQPVPGLIILLEKP